MPDNHLVATHPFRHNPNTGGWSSFLILFCGAIQDSHALTHNIHTHTSLNIEYTPRVKMVSLRQVAAAALAASSVSALPASFRLTPRQLQYHQLAVRQNEAATAAGLTDPDIMQLYVLSALSLWATVADWHAAP